MEGRIFPFNILVIIVLVIQYAGYLFPAPAVHEICVAVLVLIARLLVKRRMFSQKLAMKTEDRRPLAHMEGDEEEQSASETLPLRMGVRLKKAQASDSNRLTLEKKKRGCLDPSESMRKSWCSFPDLAKKRTDGHSFPERDGSLYSKVHREADFRQTVTVVPMTLFISHFMSPDQMQLQREGVRLSTFKDYPPNKPVSALRLAQAGFYFLGESDRVRCICCGATCEGWRFGDRPTAVHKRISPNCAFVKGTDTTSIPLPLSVTSRADFTADDSSSNNASDEFADNLGPDTQRGSALAASGEPLTRAGSFYDGRHSGAPINGQIPSMDRGAPRQLPMPSCRLNLGGAVYPMYSQMNARRRSFNTMTSPPSLPSVDELVMMGFYYAGYADCVRCFFCGVGLRSWEAGAIPAEVHARFRPTCQYLRLVKGDNFVDAVVTAFGNVSNNAQRYRGAPRHLPMPLCQLDLGDAVYPMYSQMNVRRRSFNTWTSSPSLPSVDELVMMGFYYTGYADCVRCFFCGVVLRSWEAGDFPAEVHARFRPTCQYLRLVMGDNFVDAVVTAVGNVSNNAQMVPGDVPQPWLVMKDFQHCVFTVGSHLIIWLSFCDTFEPLAHRVLVAATDGGLYLRPSLSVITQCDEDLEDHQHDRGSNRRH